MSELQEPKILAFTTDVVSRLTGLSTRRLSYWSDTEFFRPRRIPRQKGLPFGRIYSFRDVVGLRTIAMLRMEHSLSLQELRKVGKHLSDFGPEPWSSLRFWVAGSTAVFADPATGHPTSTHPYGQELFAIDLMEIAHDMRRAADRLLDRPKQDVGKVSRNRYVVHNAPVLAGTRIPTSAIWNLHKARYSNAEIMKEYPRLSPADVRAALRHEERKLKRAG